MKVWVIAARDDSPEAVFSSLELAEAYQKAKLAEQWDGDDETLARIYPGQDLVKMREDELNDLLTDIFEFELDPVYPATGRAE